MNKKINKEMIKEISERTTKSMVKYCSKCEHLNRCNRTIFQCKKIRK